MYLVTGVGRELHGVLLSSPFTTGCQRYFNFFPAHLHVTVRTAKFLNVFVASVASRELKSILDSAGLKMYGQLPSKVCDEVL